ncbi:MAG: PhzF family phenazine biosynthesis protein [Solirubrobacterales bacterium]
MSAGAGPPLAIVDAFTAEPFSGNPAAVCLSEGPLEERWMQAVAAEMNLSETAFAHPADDGWALRWFTPSAEVDLCGHATLACAHLLWERGRVSPADPVAFQTLSGELVARQDGPVVELDFPAEPATEVRDRAPALALGVDAVAIARNRMDWLVETTDADAVRGCAPDMDAIARLGERGVIVTAVAAPEDGADVVSRFFAPAVGIDEDPVTGSAHCCLGPWWSSRLGGRLRCRQLSARGGKLEVVVAGDRVLLRGSAVTMLEGALRAPASTVGQPSDQ